jgi:biotin transport system substrate-specific component
MTKSPDAAAPTTVSGVRTPVADVALVATSAAFVAVCALISFEPPGMSVPVSMQTFGVLLAGVVLGARRGGLAVLLYLLVGLAGLPVFALGRGGPAAFAGASAGYLLAFPLAAVVVGWLVTRLRRLPTRWLPVGIFAAAVAATVAVVYPIGITVMSLRTGLSAGEAIAAGAVFAPWDAAKAAIVAVVGAAVLRAFPDMLERR